MTAQISIRHQRLAVERSGVARWMGASVNVPLEHVVAVGAVDPRTAQRWWIGVRLAGIQLPGLMTAGLFRHDGAVTWWDVRRGREAIAITLRDESLARLVVAVDDAHATIRLLERALGSGAKARRRGPGRRIQGRVIG